MAADFDIVVIGGGVNGCGLARDAQGRGLRVLLVEADDLASATSSASSKLIHGGLRYLEHFEFKLVRESLAERGHLLRIAPHLVRPMQFVLPHARGQRPRWMLRLGLFLYDRLGGSRSLPGSRSVRLDREPLGRGLRAEHRRGFVYSDCSVDDARLVLVNALDAHERGAAIRTRTRCLGGERAADHWSLRLRDERDGREEEVRARAVANLAGPWADRLAAAFPEAPARTRLRLVKGSHIVVPRVHEGDHAFLLQNDDGRIVFVIPWLRDTTLIGTTEVTEDQPGDRPEPSEEEIDYLCRACAPWLAHPPEPDDALWTFAGWRPLLEHEGASDSSLTRDFRFELDDAGPPLLHVFGGKLTSYRRLAEKACEALHPAFPDLGDAWTAHAPLPGSEEPAPRPPAGLAGLAARHGCRWPRIAATASELGRDWGGGLHQAEVDHLAATEWAEQPDDFLYRRTKAGVFMTAAERRAFKERFRPAEPAAAPDGR